MNYPAKKHISFCWVFILCTSKQTDLNLPHFPFLPFYAILYANCILALSGVFFLEYFLLGRTGDKFFLISISATGGDTPPVKRLFTIPVSYTHLDVYKRQVIVVLSFIVLFLFIIDARIEYPFLAHLYEGLDVAVNHLSRITRSI